MIPPDPHAVEWTRAKRVTLTAAVGLYAVCMVLPLVGPAGVRAPHAMINTATFLAVAGIGGVLSVIAWILCRRDLREGIPAPFRVATVLAILHGLFVAAFLILGF